MKYAFTSFLLATLLTGCVGAFVPIKTVETTGIKVADAAGKISLVTGEQAKTMQVIGEVVGYSCKNKLWDANATADAATFQVKLSAAQLNASAITNLNCTQGSTSLATNCWSSFTCRATALR